MNSIQNGFSSIEKMADRLLANKTQEVGKKSDDVSFEQILSKKQSQSEPIRRINSRFVKEPEELKFSRHANERLAERNIDLSSEMLERLEHGASRAREKGIKESLVMVDELAFIVNVKNNVVITAVGNAEDAVFTNIDGAVFS